MPTLLTVILYISIAVITFLFMEAVAWFLHKYVMHGFGWYIHEDHHRPTKGRFEKNDIFGLFFAILSFLLILTGYLAGFDIRFPIGSRSYVLWNRILFCTRSLYSKRRFRKRGV